MEGLNMNNKYIVFTDDRKKNGHFTKWAEIEKDNITFLKACFDYFMKLKNPDAFYIYDTENKKVYQLSDCKFMEV